MHQDNIEWSDYMDAWRADPANAKRSKAGDDRTPAFRWLGSVYHDHKVICIGQENLSRCLMEAGALMPTGKGQKTFKAQTQSGMRVDQLLVPLLVDGQPIPWKPLEALRDTPSFPDHMAAANKAGFSLFIKRAKIGQAKHIRVRPRFDSWGFEFTVSVTDDAITEQILRTIFDLAGQYKGLCDWRPGCKTPGSFGIFRVVSVDEI